MATRIPDDFELTSERRAVAEKYGLNPDETFELFVDFWRAEGGQKARKEDWDATWRVWCRREQQFYRKGTKPVPEKQQEKERRQILDLAKVFKTEQQPDESWDSFRARVLQANERRLASLG